MNLQGSGHLDAVGGGRGERVRGGVSKRVVWAALVATLSLAPVATAHTGLSGAIGFSRGVSLIILACVVLGTATNFAVYKLVRRKWVWWLWPLIVGVILTAVWAIQYM